MDRNALLRFHKTDVKVIKHLGPDIKQFMMKFGILPQRYSEIVNIFNTYKDYKALEDCSKREAVMFCAKYYHSSERTIWNIVNALE